MPNEQNTDIHDDPNGSSYNYKRDSTKNDIIFDNLNSGVETNPSDYIESTPNRENAKSSSQTKLDGKTITNNKTKDNVTINAMKEKIDFLGIDLKYKENTILELQSKLNEKSQINNELLGRVQVLEKDNEELRENLETNETYLLESEKRNNVLTVHNEELKSSKDYLSNYISQLVWSDIPIGTLIMKNYELYKKDANQRIIMFSKILKDENIDIEEHLFKDRKTITSMLDTSFDRIIKDFQNLKLHDNHELMETLTDVKELKENILSSNASTQEVLNNIKDEFYKEMKIFETHLAEKDIEIKELILTNEKNETRIKALKKQYQELLGDSECQLSFKDVKCPDVTKKIYDSLGLQKIEQLDNITLQNQLKQICVAIQTPYNKIQRKIILANVLIKNELVHALNFINLLYYQIHEDNLDFHELENKAYKQYLAKRDIDNLEHPLKPILDDLFHDIMFELTPDI
ncbi:hypothetical protein C6P45_003379 [Maudiozyma exigua]|uniref:Uncharacterized protein n=1 Tax=Maudiozyma exigua TaxID=34358 RepID=A0A9P6WD10_MAUEX|nr:hypothetical protein C6P45_003379 [Kazachstania exigua]